MSRGFCAVGLDHAKDRSNVGSALRAVGVFDAAFLAVSGPRYQRHPADTMATYRHVPLIQVEDLRTVIPFACVPVAVEIVPGAVELPQYTHPERAFYVFGAEDHTLGERVLSWCRDVIFVPTSRCLNLAACVNVVLYDRCSKRREWPACTVASIGGAA